MYGRKIVLSLIGVSFLLQSSCSNVEPESKNDSHHEKHDKQVSSDHGSDSHDQSSSHDTSSSKNKLEHHAQPKRSSEKHADVGAIDAGITAKKSLGWLKNGNSRYVRGALRADGQSKKDRERLIVGQKPHAIVLSCSDSRVPPEVLFDQKLGEIFVVRTAGEALDSAAIASIEYALEHLGSHLIVVMAHESCGAVKAAFTTAKGRDAGSPALNALVQDIQPRLKNFMGHEPSKGFLSEARANASGVARDLVARSQIVAEKVHQDELQIETAIYHLGSGRVEFYSTPAAAQQRGLASEH